ncbi:hypothetical protein BD414DRAFT_476306 [Trametes punicea]|nr:hypothetical protein BD414DRAFT_476306 [Trametes punicea]
MKATADAGLIHTTNTTRPSNSGRPAWTVQDIVARHRSAYLKSVNVDDRGPLRQPQVHTYERYRERGGRAAPDDRRLVSESSRYKLFEEVRGRAACQCLPLELLYETKISIELNSFDVSSYFGQFLRFHSCKCEKEQTAFAVRQSVRPSLREERVCSSHVAALTKELGLDAGTIVDHHARH